MKYTANTRNVGAGMLLVVLLLFVLGVGGWVANLVRFANSDFEAPYASEIIRGVGVVGGPIGSVLGFMTIGDEGEEK